MGILQEIITVRRRPIGGKKNLNTGDKTTVMTKRYPGGQNNRNTGDKFTIVKQGTK